LPIITATRLHKSYGSRVVLDSVDVSIMTGERVGVVGHNGSGKSTLARILAGVEPSDQGELARRREARIAYLEQVPRFDAAATAGAIVEGGLVEWTAALQRYRAATRLLEEATGAALDEHLAAQARASDEVESLGGWDQSHRVTELLRHLGIRDREACFGRLSGGEQRRVALARILIGTPTLAILDEPTNHLDTRTIDWLEQYLQSEYRGALMLITHDRYLLDRLVERTLEVDQGRLFSYDGGYEAYLEQKDERERLAERTEQNQRNFLRRELEWLRRQPKARSTKQKARIERAEQVMSIRAPRSEVAPRFEIETTRTGRTILELHGLSVEVAGRTLVRELELSVAERSMIGVVGPNGSGKTSLLRAILGELVPSQGRIVRGQNTRIAYFDQLRSGLDDTTSILENVAGDASRITLGDNSLDPRSYLERFGFFGLRQRQPVGSLSGGERARVALARLLTQPANLLLLDEPTNDLDVMTLTALESMLVDNALTAIIVTHDRYLLDRIATQLLVFEDDGEVSVIAGNYQSYLARAQAPSHRSERPEPPKPPIRSAEPKNKRPLTFAETRELAGLMDRIGAAEARVSELEARLGEPELYREHSPLVASLSAELEQAKLELTQLMERWEELEQKAARP